jgi:hypothetical protein
MSSFWPKFAKLTWIAMRVLAAAVVWFGTVVTTGLIYVADPPPEGYPPNLEMSFTPIFLAAGIAIGILLPRAWFLAIAVTFVAISRGQWLNVAVPLIGAYLGSLAIRWARVHLWNTEIPKPGGETSEVESKKPSGDV